MIYVGIVLALAFGAVFYLGRRYERWAFSRGK